MTWAESETVEFKTSFNEDVSQALVAQIFKDAGWIEKYGSGIKRVRSGFEHHGMPMPEYQKYRKSLLQHCREVLT